MDLDTHSDAEKYYAQLPAEDKVIAWTEEQDLSHVQKRAFYKDSRITQGNTAKRQSRNCFRWLAAGKQPFSLCAISFCSG